MESAEFRMLRVAERELHLERTMRRIAKITSKVPTMKSAETASRARCASGARPSRGGGLGVRWGRWLCSQDRPAGGLPGGAVPRGEGEQAAPRAPPRPPGGEKVRQRERDEAVTEGPELGGEDVGVGRREPARLDAPAHS